MEFFLRFTDVILNYYTLLLGRCALFSAFIMAFIMLMRIPLKNRTFLKGLLWGLLLLTPFIGRLRLYYESYAGAKATYWWTAICMSNLWLSRLYMAGVGITACLLLLKRVRLARYVKGMKKEIKEGTLLHVCKERMTPFTTGAFRPKIVVSKEILDSYGEEELNTILLHEKTHIRLGHLFFYLIWDILHALFWANPLFIICLKYFKADCEEVCDLVTIQAGGGTGYEYGKLLIKSLKFLNGTGQQAVAGPFPFAGEDSFGRLKERVRKVAGYRKYDGIKIRIIAGVMAAGLIASVAVLGCFSYKRYEVVDEITVYDRTGRNVVAEWEEIEGIAYQKDNVLYVDSVAFNQLLNEKGIEEDYYAFFFGFVHKLPGYGGFGNCEIVNTEMLESEQVVLPFERANQIEEWLFRLM